MIKTGRWDNRDYNNGFMGNAPIVIKSKKGKILFLILMASGCMYLVNLAIYGLGWLMR